MTFVWKDKALRLAGKRGVAKARAYGLAANRRVPITLAKVRWLERPEIAISEREKTGKAPATAHIAASTGGAARATHQGPRRAVPTREQYLHQSFHRVSAMRARGLVLAIARRRLALALSRVPFQSISF
jgi:hypothetical protein